MQKRITENLITVNLLQMLILKKGKEYEYVSVGLGKEDDFKDLDLTGKLALIQRGEIPFSEKIANAFHHGQQELWSTIMWKDLILEWQLMEMLKKIPSVFISKRYGEALKAGSYKVVFNNTMA